eukprot:gene11860-12004_t
MHGQVFDRRQVNDEDATTYTVTPAKPSSMSLTGGPAVMAAAAYSSPSNMLETAGKQDEVIRLKAALNEKEMELIELREQHMQLVARSQEARANWETALDSKDSAIAQLEEALASRQRALDNAACQAAEGQEEASAALSVAQSRAHALEAALAEARAAVISQSEAMSDQARQLEAARQAAGQETAAVEARVRALQQEQQLSQQPSKVQQQLAELHQQLEVVQHRATAKEASSRKYKEAVRAFKVKLQERDDALSQRQAHILELHTELSQLQRLLKLGPQLAAGAQGSPVSCSPGPGGLEGRFYSSDCGRAGSVEGALTAATDELERLRQEVHAFHVELAALQTQLAEKDGLLQQALSDAAALDCECSAAAARAEGATQAAFSIEKQLLEAQENLAKAEAECAATADKLAAAEAQLTGLRGDQTRSIRAEGELRGQVESLTEQLDSAQKLQLQLKEQLKKVEQREADANRRVAHLEQRVLELESKLDATATEAGHLMRRADRHETATSTLQAQLELAARAASESEVVALEADGRLREAGRQLMDLQQRCDELLRRCEGLEKEAEAAALNWQSRARQLDDARQELAHQLTSNDTAMKELQGDLAQLQLAHSSERQQLQMQQDALQATLLEAKAAKAQAELRLLEGERHVAEMQSAVEQQERLLVVLRAQLEEGRQAAQQVVELENMVQMLESALSEQRHTVSHLQAARAALEGQKQSESCRLLAELADKSNQLVDAEKRFSQLEALMGRIASRTGQAGSLAH